MYANDSTYITLLFLLSMGSNLSFNTNLLVYAYIPKIESQTHNYPKHGTLTYLQHIIDFQQIIIIITR